MKKETPKTKIKVIFESGKDKTHYNVTKYYHCGQELVIHCVHLASGTENVFTYKNFAGTCVSKEY